MVSPGQDSYQHTSQRVDPKCCDLLEVGSANPEGGFEGRLIDSSINRFLKKSSTVASGPFAV